jgi:hypothetical protein
MIEILKSKRGSMYEVGERNIRMCEVVVELSKNERSESKLEGSLMSKMSKLSKE